VAGQTNPHRGARFEAKIVSRAKHVLATPNSRTNAEAVIRVREIIASCNQIVNLSILVTTAIRLPRQRRLRHPESLTTTMAKRSHDTAKASIVDTKAFRYADTTRAESSELSPSEASDRRHASEHTEASCRLWDATK